MSGGKQAVALADLDAAVRRELDAAQAALLAEATRLRDDRTVDASTIDDVVAAAATGFARIPWDRLGPDGEARLAEHAVSVRCLVGDDGSVPEAEDAPGVLAVCGRAY